ncbi:MAG: OmpA family protein [Candidatus Methylophosphatis roskildensis]
MKTTLYFTARSVLAMSLAATLAACASAPTSKALDEARAAYGRAAADAQVVRTAPVELRKAQQALEKAEAALRADEDASDIEHYAYLAKQRTEVAIQTEKLARAEQAVADASQQRDRILIDARTREAEAQRGKAEAARKLAEERLAAAQASKSQADSARARAKTLEEQLDQLKAKQTKRGMVLTLGDVLFDTGRATLNPGAARAIDQLATFLKENPARTIEIEGYTDSVGSEQMNQTLSERRANAVKNALMDRGIESNRIAARGFGEGNPVASNATAAGRQQNRRVEIVISGTSR